ncbi:hypothetical protein Tco_0725327 [Tanacetum coccineum]|uniref:Uncharacterized protein n=1 Tax=Tanacetum coccineum TaxID=301880 RepID=A0ABQ4YDH6_9ASTR
MLTAVAGRRWIIGHGFRLAVMKCAQSTECRVTLGKVILLAIDKGFQEGLEAGIEHGKAGKSLSKVAAYDFGVEVAYVAAVNELESMPLPLLEQLEALKYSPLELLMSALTLEGGHGDEDPTLEFRKLQPVSEQVTVSVYFKCGGSRSPDAISHEILMFEALAASRVCYEQHQKSRLEVSGLSQSSQGGSLVVAGPPALGAANVDGTVPLYDDMFDVSILDKPSDY